MENESFTIVKYIAHLLVFELNRFGLHIDCDEYPKNYRVGSNWYFLYITYPIPYKINLQFCILLPLDDGLLVLHIFSLHLRLPRPSTMKI